MFVDPPFVDVIAPNFKQRLSGVTSTIIQLIPFQRDAGLRIATLGPGLPDHLPRIRFRDLWQLWRRPVSGNMRVGMHGAILRCCLVLSCAMSCVCL
jgi:mannosyltransferase